MTPHERAEPRRYEAVHGETAKRRGPGPLADAAWALAAAAPGAGLWFPGAFDRATARLAADPWARGLPAAWPLTTFGDRLTIPVATEAVTLRLPDFVRDARAVSWTGRSFLDGADWSGALMPAAQCHVYEEMAELVAADLDFRATRSYRKAKKAAQQGRPMTRNGRPLDSDEALKAYFRRDVDLIRSIRKHGLLRRSPGLATRFDRPRHAIVRTRGQEAVERGIGVAIDADGSVVRHLAGRHRWGAVKALGLAEAVVEVRLVHVAWLTQVSAEIGLAPHKALLEGLARLSPGA